MFIIFILQYSLGDVVNQKNRRAISFIVISYIIVFGGIGIGLGVYIGYSIKQDAWLFINCSRLNWGDQKLIILVDVPSTGGKANQFFMYEIVNNGFGDNWYFYEGIENSNKPSVSNPKDFDFIIVVASDSNGNDKWDDFSLKMEILDSELNDKWDWVSPYNFGDDAGNCLATGVWQLSKEEDFTFLLNGLCVASLHCQGRCPSYSSLYPNDDWNLLWDCLEGYFYDGDEQEVENLIVDFSFPAPYLVTK